MVTLQGLIQQCQRVACLMAGSIYMKLPALLNKRNSKDSLRERGPGKKESNCGPFRKQLLWLVSMYRNHADQRSTNFPNMWHSEVNTSQVSQLMSRVDMNMNEMSNSKDFQLYRIRALRLLWNCCTINYQQWLSQDWKKLQNFCWFLDLSRGHTGL